MKAFRERNRERLTAKERARWQERKDQENAKRREARAQDPEAFRAQQRAWRNANLERARETQRRSYERRRDEVNANLRQARKDDPERFREYERTKRRRHAEAIKARQAAYYEAHPEVFERHRAKRRARKADVEHQPYTRREIYERDGGECRTCHKQLAYRKGSFQIDHIVPISLGGPDIPANLQLLCPKCNRAKWANLEGQIHLPV